MRTDSKVLSTWHNIVRTRDARGLDALLADDVVFYSPVVHTQGAGKAITTMYLSAAVQVFGGRIVQIRSRDRRKERSSAGVCDRDRRNHRQRRRCDQRGTRTGSIEFKVMIRPHKAINLIHKMMAQKLG